MSDQKSIYLFYGADNFSLTRKVNFWIKEFEKKHSGDINIDTIEAKTLEPKAFGTNLQAMPFLAEKRLVIVKDFLDKGSTDNQKTIAKIIENTPDFCVLVFTENKTPDKRLTLYKKLSKIAKVEEFREPSPQETTTWITKEVQEKGGQIGFAEANFLSAHVGPNLWQLSNEIEKLVQASKSEPDGKITKQLIESLVSASISSSIFKLTDAIAAKNRKGSLNIFKKLIDSGEGTMMVFYMIVRHFRILIQSKYLTDQGQSPDSIARTLKQHPFVAKTSSQQSRNFSPETLKEIYRQLLEIDKKFKTGGIKVTVEDQSEFLLEIERFIINLSR